MLSMRDAEVRRSCAVRSQASISDRLVLRHLLSHSLPLGRRVGVNVVIFARVVTVSCKVFCRWDAATGY